MRRRQMKIPSRRGVATLELILVVPILLIVLIFSIQFGIVAIYQATVTHSATVAVREAGKGADQKTVVDVVRQIVGIHGVDISDDAGSGTKVVLDWDPDFENGISYFPPLEYGDPLLECPPPANEPEFDEIRVTVCVDVEATRFCDALAPWGLTFAGRMFRASSLVKRELQQDTWTP